MVNNKEIIVLRLLDVSVAEPYMRKMRNEMSFLGTSKHLIAHFDESFEIIEIISIEIIICLSNLY